MSSYHNNFSPQQLKGSEFRQLTSLLKIRQLWVYVSQVNDLFHVKEKRSPSQCVPLFWHVRTAVCIFNVCVFTDNSNMHILHTQIKPTLSAEWSKKKAWKKLSTSNLLLWLFRWLEMYHESCCVSFNITISVKHNLSSSSI